MRPVYTTPGTTLLTATELSDNATENHNRSLGDQFLRFLQFTGFCFRPNGAFPLTRWLYPNPITPTTGARG
jgi:hypothetical protein